ncbi:MAG: PAS domain-containing protein, partial [Clostridia bacterium]|nr:PAS domain-containing protein [Clostridia bacterium]
SGEKRIIRWNNSVIRNEMNEVTGTISSGEDITNIRLNEKKLLDNEQSLKQAEKKAKMGHWVRKPEEDILVWSDGLYQMFGYEVNEFPAEVGNSLIVIHEDDREKYRNLISRAVEFGESYSIDMKGIKKDGEIFYIRVDADVTLGEDGKTSVIYGIVTDITETHNRIKELEEAKNRLDLAEAMSKTGHWQRNLKTNTYIFSDELYRIFGIDEGVKLITHELLHERFHPDDRKKISAFTEEKLKKGEDYSFEGRIKKPDGSVSFIEAHVQVKKDKSGQPMTASGVMRDITELKTHEIKLQESEFQLKRAEEISGTGNWIMDLKTGKYTCSDNFYKICGFDPESIEATFESIMSATHPEDIDRINEIIAKSMKTGEDYEFENRLILPDGSIRYVRSKGTYIKDKKGRPIKSVGTLLDITEFKKAETILIESREKLEKAEEIAHVGHWERDFKTGKSYWSDEIYRILGHEPQIFEASERKYAEFIHPDDYEGFIEKSRLAHEGKIPYIIETRVVDSKGNLKYIRSRGGTLKENGRIVKTFGTLEDITEEKLRENELMEKNRMLDEAEAVSHVGHFINDYKKGTRYWSDEMFRILGYEPQADIDKNTLYKKLMEPLDFKNNVEAMNKAIKNKKDTHEVNFTIYDAAGNKKYLKHLYRFRYENDEHVASFGVVQDMTEVKTHYEDMEYMNYHDALTDLYNRRYFDETFTEIDVPENYPLSVITADINGLKMTNDTISHSAGDRLIMKAARILKSVCEEGDILARIGGNDFILVMPLTTQSQAEMVINELHELFAAANEEVPISVSMGLAVKLKADKSKEDFLKEAEDNMYTSKLYEKTSKRGDLLRLIMDTLYERSSREEKHSERVSNYCGEMGKALKMPKYKINELTALGLLHDIGKIAVKDSVLNKPDKLNEEEWLEIRKHSETGYRILSQSPGMLQASKYVLAHHERWDGKGYPQGLKTYEIPTQARIISICDAFDAMRSKRPYRDPVPMEEAVAEIRKGAGSQFDPELAKVFVVMVLGEKW